MPYLVIYLHGFLSSPQSVKAQQTLQFVGTHYPNLALEIPDLGNTPKQAVQIIEQLIKQHQGKKLRFIGSSLGGYFSTYMANKYAAKAVLINPAVKPYELLVDFVGEHQNPYTQQRFSVEEQHIKQLKEFDTPKLNSQAQYWALLQTADETLDYRQAAEKYQAHKLTIEPGGDHSFQNFQRFLPDIFRFLLQE